MRRGHPLLHELLPQGADAACSLREAGPLCHRPDLPPAERHCDVRHRSGCAADPGVAAAAADGDESQDALQDPVQDHHRGGEYYKDHAQGLGSKRDRSDDAGDDVHLTLFCGAGAQDVGI